MTAPTDRTTPPLAEPGKRTSGGDVGGMRASADAGVADSLQRSSERADESGVGRARAGDASAAATDPRVDPSRRATGATSNDDDEDEWRHEPIAPIDEGNPLRSLGKAVGDTITGSDAVEPTSTTTRSSTPTKGR